MRDATSMLILLGLVCQGFSFESWLAPLLYALLWLVCQRLRRERPFIPRPLEDLITVGAVAFAFHFGGIYGFNRLVFIGNALVAFQVVRMLRPLSPREQAFSLAVAVVHVCVGAQVIVEFRFLFVFVAALALVPLALAQLEAEAHRHEILRLPRLPRRVFACIAVLTAVFFLVFPRHRFMRYGNPFYGGSNRRREQLDMASGGGRANQSLVFRIEGEDISYIRSSTLDTWDGRTWTASLWSMQATQLRAPLPADRQLRRTVRVVNPSLLGATLPCDGAVFALEGGILVRPHLCRHGGLTLPFRMRRNIDYDYQTVLRTPELMLPDTAREKYLAVSPPSAELRTWLDRVVGGVAEPSAVAGALARHFQENHDYEIGAPDLDRADPVEEFVLEQRPGHCERFASALAVLLRMKGIPARVAVGWLPTEKNEIGGFYNVRARHGHAWTEAWIDGRGWTAFDGTPYGRQMPVEDRPLGLSAFEWAEYIWYSKIVEFSVADQDRMVDAIGGGVRGAVRAVSARLGPIVGLFAGVVALLLFVRLLVSRGRCDATGTETARQAVREAQHFYGRMLRALAKQGFARSPAQTPLEFLQRMEGAGHPCLSEIRQLTAWFCGVRYGRRRLTNHERVTVGAMLRRISSASGTGVRSTVSSATKPCSGRG